MRFRVAVLSALFLLPISSFAQSNVEVENDLAHHGFYVDFSSRGQLDLRIRPAQILITGSDETGSSFGWEDGKGSVRDVQARFENTAILGCWRSQGERGAM
jgi:hypothetical protein